MEKFKELLNKQITTEEEIKNLNDIEKQCNEFECPHFKVWEYYHVNYSCDLLGESDDIKAVPLECPFWDKFKNKKKLEEEKK